MMQIIMVATLPILMGEAEETTAVTRPILLTVVLLAVVAVQAQLMKPGPDFLPNRQLLC